MNSLLRWMAALSVTALLAATPGCYTQVGTTDDLYSDEYGEQEAGAPQEEAPEAPSRQDEAYFDEDGYPLNRFYLGIGPSWVYGGVVYTTYSPWVYDPFWCWNPWPSYYWYPGWAYWPPAYYPPAYYPPYYPDRGRGYTSVRTIGSTRGGMTTGRGIGASARGEEGSRTPAVSAPSTGRPIDLPGAARVGRPGAGSGGTQAPAAAPERIRRGERSGAGNTGVRSGSSRGRSGEAVRAPRRAPRADEGTRSGQGGQAPQTRSGGRESVRPSTPPPQPPSGGTSGRGDSRPNTQPSGSGRGGGRR